MRPVLKLAVLVALALGLAACSSDDNNGQTTTNGPEGADTSLDASLNPDRAAASQALITLDDLGPNWSPSAVSDTAIQAAINQALEDIEECESYRELELGTGSQQVSATYESTLEQSYSSTALVFESEEDADDYMDNLAAEDTVTCAEEVFGETDEPEIELDESPEQGDRTVTLTLTRANGSTVVYTLARVDRGVVSIAVTSSVPMDVSDDLALMVERLANELDG